MLRNCDIIAMLRIIGCLEQSGSQIPDASSTKLTLSITIILYLTKNENRNKKYQVSAIALNKGSIFIKKCFL